MMALYIDSYFILNLAVDYLLLIATARLRALPCRRLRAFLAALLGSIYALASALWPESFFQNPLLLLAAAALMLLLAFGGTERLLATALTFAGVAAAFGGFALALGQLLGRLRVDLGILLIAFPACWLVLKLAFRGKAATMPERLQVEIQKNGQSISLQALWDSGNLLQDPVSGARVMVVEPDAVAPLFPGEKRRLICHIRGAAELLEALGPGSGFRLIPYSGVGENGLLAAFRPDTLRINNKEQKDVLVALSRESLSGNGDFCAIIGGAQCI